MDMECAVFSTGNIGTFPVCNNLQKHYTVVNMEKVMSSVTHRDISAWSVFPGLQNTSCKVYQIDNSVLELEF